MFIPILLGDDSGNDSQIIAQIQNQFLLSHPGQAVFSLPWQKMLDGYRAMIKAGKNDNDVILYWASTGMKKDDAGTFVAAMKQINKNQTIQDPMESPSMSEIITGYTKQLGDVTAGLPWGMLALALAGIIVVNQAAKKYV